MFGCIRSRFVLLVVGWGCGVFVLFLVCVFLLRLMFLGLVVLGLLNPVYSFIFPPFFYVGYTLLEKHYRQPTLLVLLI